ncbi:MAG: WD40 repeat domain-containing protein [Ardenticatenaceae bacterium]|nr:WD40 repeat domain-containing protein [Ardenticatenaceae bacterium]
MMKQHSHPFKIFSSFWVVAFTAVMILAAGCASQSMLVTSTETPTAGAAVTQAATATAVPSPTATSTIPIPTKTPAPTLTATPTQIPGPTPIPVDISSDSQVELQTWFTLGRKLVQDLALSPDGTMAALAVTGRIYLYSIPDLTQIGYLVSPSEEFGTIAFSPDGQFLAAGSDDRTVRVWDVTSQTLIHELSDHNGSTCDILFSPDGQTVAAATSGSVYFWNVADGTQNQVIEAGSWPNNPIAFSPDGQLLALTRNTLEVELWDRQKKQLIHTLEGPEAMILELAFTPDGRAVSSFSTDGIARYWAVDSGDPLKAIEGFVPAFLYDIAAFSPDGQTITSVSARGQVVIRETAAGKILHESNFGVVPGDPPIEFDWRQIAYASDGQTVATIADGPALHLWDIQTGSLINSVDVAPLLLRLSASIREVDVSADGNILAVAVDDQSLWMWDLENGSLLYNLDGLERQIQTIAFSPDGRTLATGMEGGEILFWDVSEGRRIEAIDTSPSRVLDLSFSPDGEKIAAALTDRSIQIWDISSETPNQVFEAGNSPFNYVTFSADGRSLAAATSQTIYLWDIATGSLIDQFNGGRRGYFSLDSSWNGQLLIAGTNDDTIHVWETITEEHPLIIREVAAYSRPEGIVKADLSPDGQTIAAASNSSVGLWHTANGNPIVTLEGLQCRGMIHVSFTADGRTVIAVSREGVVCAWRILPE